MEADHPAFEAALAALDGGDVEELRVLVDAHPELVRARVTTADPPYDGYFHGATLLHHVAGNPIRGELPDNIVDVARVVLEAGADPDAGCGGGPAQPGTANGTTLGLVVTGAQAHIQGHTEALIDMLLEHGATLDRDAGMFGTLYHTVEHKGQRGVARMLYERGVQADLPTAAGLGDLDLVRTFFGVDGGVLPDSDRIWRRSAGGGRAGSDEQVLADAMLAASANGWPEITEFLLDHGAPLNALRPWGPFHVTPLHAATWAGWPNVVQELIRRGADRSIREPTYDGRPVDWAYHCGHGDVVALLRDAG
jgi:hypothetical protein